MSGLEAFSVACNVMQAIHFTGTAIPICKDIYEGCSPAPGVESRCSELRSIALDLENDRKKASPNGPENEKQLARIVDSMLAGTLELEKELSKLRNTGSPSIVAAVKNTRLYYFRPKSKIEKIEDKIRNDEKLMESRILVRMSKDQDALQAMLSAEARNMPSELKSFVQHLKDGNTRLEQLIENKTGEINSVVQKEGETMRQTVVAESKATRSHL
ncbi:hypothetical protein DM02DRAFT_686045 [Periconia macrospinosa]|uniref:NACHT-NTPase and P-loop NTPases N-terminal domain-containing protein n=1 Tax=Periconia macrospinosa TaxID=97972 RepID=A0A2V1DHE5_9PLEO|nr:hypothetical protein DM02DRAFT_686045 [Periconia macrospinosa]